MSENMALLPSVSPSNEGSEISPYYYVYGYPGSSVTEAKATENYSVYGVLYNWEAAKTACPAGWHLPSDDEWIILTGYLGGDEIAGGKIRETGTVHWISPNTGATNESGFNALPGGSISGGLYGLGNLANFWTSTPYVPSTAYDRILYNNYAGIIRSNNFLMDGLSVRCIKN
jgi:uncharacterized protein (TIGR02145 family)